MPVTFDEEEEFHTIFTYDASKDTWGGSFAGQTNWDYFPDDIGVGDAIYFGKPYNDDWNDIKLYIGTPVSAVGLTLVWEYYGSGGWKILMVNDGSQGFTLTGTRWIVFDLPSDARETVVHGYEKIWVRVRVTAVTSSTEGGANSTETAKCRNRRITVDNYSETNPANFDTLKQADNQGEAVLMPPMPCTTGLVPARSVRPVEYGAIKIDFILSGTTAGTGDTLVITGTDAEGNVQTETIDVSAGNGIYTSTKLFKTITNIDCVGWSDGTLEVRQNLWGVVWKIDNTNFVLDRPLVIGKGTNPTHFKDTRKTILFSSKSNYNYYNCVEVKNAGVFTLGEVIDEITKATKMGCHILWDNTNDRPFHSIISAGTQGALAYLYSSIFTCLSSARVYGAILNLNGRLWNCIGNTVNVGGANNPAVGNDVYNFTTCDSRYGWSYGQYGNFDTYKILGADIGIYFYSSYKTVVTNLTVKNCTTPIVGYWLSYDKVIINGELDDWTVTWWKSTNTKGILRKYHFDLKVLDKNGKPIESAKVKITDKNGNEVYSGTTDADGKIPQQTITYEKYEDGTGGQGGKISIITAYHPFTLEIWKEGFQKYKSVLEIDRKTALEISLKRPSLSLTEDICFQQ